MTTATASDGERNYASSSQPTGNSISGSGPTYSPRRQTRFPLYTPEHVLPRSKLSQSEDVTHRRWKKPRTSRGSTDKRRFVSERTPLLRGSSEADRSLLDENDVTFKQKKPFYRARPLWLVPFAIVAALVRGMTLAPRVEVYTQLSCYAVHGRHEYNATMLPEIHLGSIEWDRSSAISLYAGLDPLGPYLYTNPSHHSNNTIHSPVLGPIETPLPLPRKEEPRSEAPPDSDVFDKRHLPSTRCLADPAVQANAAKLQAIVTTTMGLLSAITTGWWGRFGERYGRTKVLAVATIGLFWTDLVFILTSTPHLPFPLSWFSYTSRSNRAHHLLLLGPLVEGLFGGWSTLQSATSAYISDCTSPGSRAQIFSRFTGVFYLGFSFGPAIAAWVIRHPDLFHLPSSDTSSGDLVDLAGKTIAQRQTVTAVFWLAVLCSFVNFLLVLFVFPESLTKEKREQAKQTPNSFTAASSASSSLCKSNSSKVQKYLRLPVTGVEDADGVGIGAIVDVDEITSPATPSSSTHFPAPDNSSLPQSKSEGIFMSFMRPLAVFLPVYIDMPTRNGLTIRRRKDYSLTLLACALLAWMLSSGVYQIKYLYAGHTYSWGPEKLSYYISFTGAARALFLLLILPFLIATFKSKPRPESTTLAIRKGKTRAHQGHHDEGHDVEANHGSQNGKKPTPSRMELGKAIRFDLRLTRFSLLVDILGNLLIAVAPSPTLTTHGMFRGKHAHRVPHKDLENIAWAVSRRQSETLFYVASALNSFASGMVPAVHSLALCIVQARALEGDFGSLSYDGESSDGPSVPPPAVSAVDTGTLFGAFAILQAVGQMILGPMLFGIIYSGTVASHPKTIFIVATSLLVSSLVLVTIVKNPVGEYRLERRQKKFRRRMEAGYGAYAVSSGSTGMTYRQPPVGKGKAKNWEQEIERRGRPRKSKDLRGGAVGWHYGAEGSSSDQSGHMMAQSA